MRRFRRLYGSHPGHLVAMLVAFAFAGYGFTRLFQEDKAFLRLGLWFLGALVVNDFVLLPAYLGIHRLAGRALGADADAPSRRRLALLHHLLIPATISAFLFIAWVPLILRLGIFPAITTLSLAPYVVHWALITAGLFALSALILGLRVLLGWGLPEADATEETTRAPDGAPPVAADLSGRPGRGPR